ncbi:MAG: methylated-DNA--[protein]-cysteine S-methyltransferase [Prevotella sp.]|nr:methylated-DNA--[protein]-cysteine S-methyltransferase [Prevotella sp.]
MICIQYFNSPCGELVLASMGDELCLCDWNGMPCAERNLCRIRRYVNADFRTEPSSVIEQTKRQLDEYFAGSRKEFDIPLHPFGTDFQLQVWRALFDIPYGETRTYMEIALKIGNAKGVRAVAQAIGANGIDILIPCHRVVGSNNSLTGYTGGLGKKKFLLKIERRYDTTDRIQTIGKTKGLPSHYS